jgi:transcriptional regulator with XRE-family HTH domain
MVARARLAAGYSTVRKFAQAIGVTENRLYRLEGGRSVGRNVLVAIELGLKWGPGSTEHVLEGGSPHSDPPLDNEAERELWQILKLIKSLTHAERLAHLEIHRKYRPTPGDIDCG